ncbi:hypothetical protein ACO0SA_001155 [Hanseniaspora valbyensis]
MNRNKNFDSNKENEPPLENTKENDFLKRHKSLNTSSLYRNNGLKPLSSLTNSPIRNITPLNTKINTLKKRGLTSPQRQSALTPNMADFDFDDLDRFSVMKKRSSVVNFSTTRNGSVVKPSINTQMIRKNSSPLNKNKTSLLNNFNSVYSHKYTLENEMLQHNSSVESESLFTDPNEDNIYKIKANDSPEKQIQIINEKIFKEQIKRICQDSSINDNALLSTNRQQQKSNTNSPEKIIQEIYECNSPMKSPVRSPIKSPTKDLQTEAITNNDDVLMSYLKPHIQLKKISKIPQRILDAPNFNPDITLTQIAWSAKNVLAVVLGNVVYLWNETSNKTIILQQTRDKKIVTNICWCSDAIHLLIAYADGRMELFDTFQKSKKREIISVLGSKIITADWYDTILVIGNSNGTVTIHDVSKKNHLLEKIQIDSEDNEMFISKVLFNHSYNKVTVGCSDGQLRFYDFEKTEKLTLCFSDTNHHEESMIKAMQFNPIYPNILATGSFKNNFGYMNFYDLRRNKFLKKIETGVEITSINWNYDSSNDQFEIAITCGSPNNSIAIYDYNSGFKIAEIHNAHTEKIITGTMNNVNEVIATISAQENLSFFKIFDNQKKKNTSSIKKNQSTSNLRKPENKETLNIAQEKQIHSFESPSENLTIR